MSLPLLVSAAVAQDLEVEQALLSSRSFKRVDWGTDGNEERGSKTEKRVLYRRHGVILIWSLQEWQFNSVWLMARAES